MIRKLRKKHNLRRSKFQNKRGYTEPDLVEGLALKHQKLRLLIKEQEANGINMYLSVFTVRWVSEDWLL